MIIPNIWKNKKCSKPPTSKGLPWITYVSSHPVRWGWHPVATIATIVLNASKNLPCANTRSRPRQSMSAADIWFETWLRRACRTWLWEPLHEHIHIYVYTCIYIYISYCTNDVNIMVMMYAYCIHINIPRDPVYLWAYVSEIRILANNWTKITWDQARNVWNTQDRAQGNLVTSPIPN